MLSSEAFDWIVFEIDLNGDSRLMHNCQSSSFFFFHFNKLIFRSSCYRQTKHNWMISCWFSFSSFQFVTQLFSFPSSARLDACIKIKLKRFPLSTLANSFSSDSGWKLIDVYGYRLRNKKKERKLCKIRIWKHHASKQSLQAHVMHQHYVAMNKMYFQRSANKCDGASFALS